MNESGRFSIDIFYDDRCGYSVACNGIVILECLSEDEVGGLTIAEMQELLLMANEGRR